MLDHGADPKVSDARGPALIQAIRGGFDLLAQKMLERSATSDFTDAHGHSPAQGAKHRDERLPQERENPQVNHWGISGDRAVSGVEECTVCAGEDNDWTFVSNPESHADEASPVSGQLSGRLKDEMRSDEPELRSLETGDQYVFDPALLKDNLVEKGGLQVSAI